MQTAENLFQDTGGRDFRGDIFQETLSAQSRYDPPYYDPVCPVQNQLFPFTYNKIRDLARFAMTPHYHPGSLQTVQPLDRPS